MLADQVTDLDFPVEQDVALPLTYKGWRQVGNKWVSYYRPYPGPHSKIPLKKRMQTLVSCAICHVEPVLQHDRYNAMGHLTERLCAECYGTYVRSGYSSEYQRRIDDSVESVVRFQEYQQERRSEPTGEQRLAAALIASAAADLHRKNKYHGASKDRAETKAWLLGADAAVTFQWCCEAIDLDPEWARRMIYACAKYYTTQESKRAYAGWAWQAVEEYVPDANGSERSQPKRIVQRKNPAELPLC